MRPLIWKPPILEVGHIGFDHIKQSSRLPPLDEVLLPEPVLDLVDVGRRETN